MGLDPKRLQRRHARRPGGAARRGPQIESLFLLAALAEAAFLLIGGVLGDTLGRRRVLLTGLVRWRVFERARWSRTEGPLFSSHAAIGAVAAVGLVLPVSAGRCRGRIHGRNSRNRAGHRLRRLGASTAVCAGTSDRRVADHRPLAIVPARDRRACSSPCSSCAVRAPRLRPSGLTGAGRLSPCAVGLRPAGRDRRRHRLPRNSESLIRHWH